MLSVAPCSFAEIEEEARELQNEMWRRQFSIWPGERVTPMDVCDPWVAAEYLGWEVQEGYLTSPDTRAGYQLGGFIDRPARLIAVADHLLPRTKRFTLGHELGHILRHPGIQHHREIPLHGITEPRVPVERKEREANHFAGVFLVPSKQLCRAFEKQFGVESLRLTDTVAQELLGDGFMALMNAPPGTLMFERLLAQAFCFRGRQFDSLVNLFKVSPTTMAIRLRDCGLTRG